MFTRQCATDVRARERRLDIIEFLLYTLFSSLSFSSATSLIEGVSLGKERETLLSPPALFVFSTYGGIGMSVAFPKPKKPAREIWVPLPASLDALLSIALLRWCGDVVIPGIQTARIRAFHKEDMDGKTAGALMDEGIICVNCGSGLFDHHPHEKYPGQCAFTRVLDAVGLRQDPRLHELIQYVLWNDTRSERVMRSVVPNTQEGSFTWARIAAEWFGAVRTTGDPDVDDEAYAAATMKLLAVMNLLFQNYLARQDAFHNEAAEAYSGARIDDVEMRDGRQFHVVSSITSAEAFGSYARSTFGCKAEVVVHGRWVKQRSGETALHVHISTLTDAGLRLDRLALALRLEEARVRNEVSGSERDLVSDGEVHHWYYLRGNGHGAGMLLAGSRSHRHTDGTKIPFDTIRDSVINFLRDLPRDELQVRSDRERRRR